MNNTKLKRRSRGRPLASPSGGILNDLKTLLPQSGSTIRYRDLQSTWVESGRSVGTLVKYLRFLEKDKIILREVDSSIRPPAVFYRLLIEDFFIEGKDFYQNVVLDKNNSLENILEETDAVEKFKKISNRLFLELTSMVFLIGRLLSHCTMGLLPEEVEEYVDVVSIVHLLPWIKRLARVACRLDGASKMELETALDPLRLLTHKSFLSWVEEYRRTAKLPSLEDTYDILRKGGSLPKS